MPYVVAALIALVALARGGYAAWGILALELGSVGLLLWVVGEVLYATSDEERALLRAGRRSTSEVTIEGPGESKASYRARSSRDYFVIAGFPFKKTHLGIPFGLLTVWILLSLLPLDAHWLERLSPKALELRSDASAPWTLSPFMTARSLWMFLACFGLVAVGAHLGSNPARVRRLSLLLFGLGVGFGLHGMAQWLFGLQDLFGRDPSMSALRASGSFGNRNHYAAFMCMLFLCGLGWLATKRIELTGRTALAGRSLRRFEESGGQLFLLGLGAVVSGVGLVFSLSRSGITFALLGTAVWVALVSTRRSPDEGRGRFRSWTSALTLSLATLAIAAWVGLDPVVHRFKLLSDEWETEQGRSLVWKDSLTALPDFAVTGSGLSTYRYVFPIYRSFGGNLAYSWAHNDYIQLLIELGVPGFLLLLWVMAIVGLWSARVRKSLGAQSRSGHLHAGYVAAIVAIAFHSFTDFPLHLAANAALLSVIVGVAVGAEPPLRRSRRSTERAGEVASD